MAVGCGGGRDKGTANVQATEQTIRQVVQEVLSQLTGRAAAAPVASSRWGVFDNVDDAVAAAQQGFEQLTRASLEQRRTAIDIVKRICEEQAEELGRQEFEETKIGRLEHKIAKLKAIRTVPGVEFLRTDAVSGSHGLTVTEYAPFGVIGAITPVTHSLPTLAGNFVNMVAAGNTIVCNPHPSGARSECGRSCQLYRVCKPRSGLGARQDGLSCVRRSFHLRRAT